MPENPNNNTGEPKKNILDKSWIFFHDLIDLKDGLDREGTIINIKSNKEMKGANAWLLMCSIFIASLGLDLNSPAVIIGGMLISPLMAPILGIGLGIGVNDRQTLIISGQHLLIAIAIALVTSMIYFFISGFFEIGGGFTNEIKGRTSPSVLDAMVALIGGFAGIISSSRKDKSNAIPGVAIATALMPPLCVTGYGLTRLMFNLPLHPTEESLNFFNVVWNSFFLFFLNATLVALATYSIVQLMGFKSRSFATIKEERRSKLLLYFTSLVLLATSLFTTVNIISDNKTRKNINNFIKNELAEYKLVEYEVDKSIQSDSFVVEVDLLQTLSKHDCDSLSLLLQSPPYGVIKSRLHFNYPSEERLKEISDANGRNFSLVQKDVSQLELEVDSLRYTIEALKIENQKELNNYFKFIAQSAFPDLSDIKFYPKHEKDPAALVLKWNDRMLKRDKLRSEKEERLKEWVFNVMEVDSVSISYLK